ncbi:MAG: hypothetical protein NZ610_00960 [Candidatus Bipolaricaulota bacterium]|nr:hypothetical protein [Candidatus Bipolaricaulota bacterium]MDW8110244.1 hypothetical protein [Candidatus Bipolaricaulota bacterium]
MQISTSKGRYSIEYKTRKRYRGEPICADPTVDPRENETALYFSMADRRLWVSSYEPSIIAGLLAHRDFKIEQLVLMRIDGKDSVVGVIGRLPVGVLSIGRARASNEHDLIFARAPAREPKKAKKKSAKSARRSRSQRRARPKRARTRHR